MAAGTRFEIKSFLTRTAKNQKKNYLSNNNTHRIAGRRMAIYAQNETCARKANCGLIINNILM